jgi:HD superfamily phosphodiesterase
MIEARSWGKLAAEEMMETNLQSPPIQISHIREQTIEYGEGWGYPHVCRVLRLIGEIGADLAYDADVTLYAAYLHDWGAFPRYRQPGVGHALRSMQVAESEILPYTNLSAEARQAVLEAIHLHDYRNLKPTTCVEALLLREADMLEMLGAIGILREFAWGPNNLKICYERVLARQAGIEDRLTLPRARTLAEQRLANMDHILAQLKIESFGIL